MPPTTVDPSPRLTADGMMNLLTGLGDASRDRSVWTQYVPERTLTASTLDALYEDDGLVAKAIDDPAEDMVREGFTFEGLDKVDAKDVQSAIEDLQCLQAIADLHRWGSHYGGALLVAAVDDGKMPSEPLELESVERVRGFFVLDRHCVEPVMIGFKPPEAYIINSTVDTPLEDRVVHASRVRRFAGIEVAPRRKPEKLWWGVPLMQRVWRRFRQLASAYGYGEAILHDIAIDVFTIAGLADAFAAGNEDLVRKRLHAIQLSKSVLRAVALDAGGGPNGQVASETYVPQSRNVSGVRELIELFLQALIAVVRMPRSKLLGETPGGINTGSNSGEIREYYARIGTEQRNKATKWLNWMLEILFASREGPTRGKRPDAWTIAWHPLWQPTDTEVADVKLKQAQADQIYWTIGAVDSDEIRDTRATDYALKPEEEVDEEEETAIAGTGGDLQSTALNGAQISSFIELVQAVAAKQFPLETAVQFLPVAFPDAVPSEADARRMLAAVESLPPPPKPEPPRPGAQRPAPGPAPDEDDAPLPEA